ncbi:hypothetical protein [Aequorivita capsosiphonis]|uniref:hypothetical protein n=1 Tax=Aequorivita capsosiphonis TaxID=487317 RepID=UPI000426615C
MVSLKKAPKGKIIVANKRFKASDIYLEIGHNNLSNFSVAFKNKFGISPTDILN